MGILGVMGIAVLMTKGVPTRPGALYDPASETLVIAVSKPDVPRDCFERPFGGNFDASWVCHLGNPKAKIKILVYGDSHAQFAWPALRHLAGQSNVEVLFAGEGGCLLASRTYTTLDSKRSIMCHQLAENIATFGVDQHVDLVVDFQRWTSYGKLGKTRPNEGPSVFIQNPSESRTPTPGLQVIEHGLSQDLRRYAQADIPVLLVKDNPQQLQEYKRIPTGMIRFDVFRAHLLQEGATTYLQHIEDQAATNALLDELAKRFPNVTTLSMDSALCTDTVCPWISDGRFLYYNDDHLSEAGVMRVYPLLIDKINRILGLDIPVPTLMPLRPDVIHQPK